MFTPKNIQGALEELYDLCDPDYMVDMLVNYSEEFDDISPALLAKSFQKNAEMISEYRVLSSAGEGIDYQGKVLLNSRAVRLLSYVEDMSGDEKVRTIQSKELWLAEDMTFYVVSCMSTITMDKEEAICLNEHRSVVTTVECEDDIFFDMGSLKMPVRKRKEHTSATGRQRLFMNCNRFMDGRFSYFQRNGGIET